MRDTRHKKTLLAFHQGTNNLAAVDARFVGMSRKIRFLMKVLDGHDVGARVVARGLLEAGMEVIYTGIRRTPEQIVRVAIDEDVDVVGISILQERTRCSFPCQQLLTGPEPDILMVVGELLPQEDIRPGSHRLESVPLRNQRGGDRRLHQSAVTFDKADRVPA